MVVWPNGLTGGLTVMEQQRSNRTWSPAVGHTEHSASHKRRGWKIHLHVPNALHSMAGKAGVTVRKTEGLLLGLRKLLRKIELFLCGAALQQLYLLIFSSLACVLFGIKGRQTQRGSYVILFNTAACLLSQYWNRESKEAVTVSETAFNHSITAV